MSLRSLLCLLLTTGLMAGCGNGSGHRFGTTSIADGAITVRHDKVTLRVADAPKAAIDADGALKVDGKVVSTSDTQRVLLKQYYQAATAVREHGIATGKAGIALAGKSVKAAISSAFNDDEGKDDESAAAAEQKVNQAAMKICLDLANIRTAQDSLAAQLPAFKPYAGIIKADATHCRKHGDD